MVTYGKLMAKNDAEAHMTKQELIEKSRYGCRHFQEESW